MFSPLIGGSHSTQQYARFMKGSLYNEAVMFVNGPATHLNQTELTGQQRQGLASGIVFTEIYHTYVNPTTSPFASRVDSIFSIDGSGFNLGAIRTVMALHRPYSMNT